MAVDVSAVNGATLAPVTPAPPAPAGTPGGVTAPVVEGVTPGAAPAAPSATDGLTSEQVSAFLAEHPEHLDTWFKDKDHDTLAKIPAYNLKVKQANDRLIQETRKREEAQSQARQQAQALAAADTHFSQLEAQGLIHEALNTEQDFATYAAVKRWRAAGKPNSGSVASTPDDFYRGFRDSLKGAFSAHEDWAEVADQLDELEASLADEPLGSARAAKLYKAFLDAGNKKYRTQIRKELETEFVAKLEAERVKLHAGVPESDRLPDARAAVRSEDIEVHSHADFQRKYGFALTR